MNNYFKRVLVTGFLIFWREVFIGVLVGFIWGLVLFNILNEIEILFILLEEDMKVKRFMIYLKLEFRLNIIEILIRN